MNRTSLRRRLPLLALTVTALVVTGACSSGVDVASSPLPERPTSTSTSTTSASTSTTIAAAPTTTRVLSTTPTTRLATPPTAPKGEPRVVASPTGAGPETRVSITGDGFVAENWRESGVPLWLAGGPTGCDFFADADHDVRVTADGRLTGSFVVPSHGFCRQDMSGGLPVLAGRYRIVYQCTACTIGEFTVTESAPPPIDKCLDVIFSPNSENMASDIVAIGVSCKEAEAVVREVARPFGPINGAPRGEAGGFTCVRTGQTDGRGLPTSEYECTRGSQRITFTRT